MASEEAQFVVRSERLAGLQALPVSSPRLRVTELWPHRTGTWCRSSLSARLMV